MLKDLNFIKLFNKVSKDTQLKLINYYFIDRKKSINKVISEYMENLERSYNLAICGEIKASEIFFGVFLKFEDPSNIFIAIFNEFILELFLLIFNKKNLQTAKFIVDNLLRNNLNKLSQLRKAC